MVFASSKLKYDSLEEVWDDNPDKLVGALFSVELDNAKPPFKVQVRQAGDGKLKHNWEKYTETVSEWPMFFAAFPGGNDLSIKIKDKSSKVSGQYNLMLGALEPENQTQGEYPLSIFMKNKKAFKELSGKLTVGTYYSKLVETRPPGVGPHTYSYQNYLSEMKTGDLIVYSGTGLLAALTQLATNAPYSHVGVIVKLPNKWTSEEELYVVELTKNHNGFQDAFKEKVSSGVNIFRLKERLHHFHGNSNIWWVQQKQPLAQEKQFIEWILKMHAGDTRLVEQILPEIQNSQLKEFLASRFKIGVLNFTVLMDMYSSAFVYKALCQAGVVNEDELARYPKGMLPAHLLQYGCFGDAVRIRAPAPEGTPVTVSLFPPAETASSSHHHRGHIRRHSSGASGRPTGGSPAPPAGAQTLGARVARGASPALSGLGPAAGRGVATNNGVAPNSNSTSNNTTGNGGTLPPPLSNSNSRENLPTTPLGGNLATTPTKPRSGTTSAMMPSPGMATPPPPLSSSGGSGLSGSASGPSAPRGRPSPRAVGAPPMLPPREDQRGSSRREQMVLMQQKFGASKLAIKTLGMEDDNPQSAVEKIVAKMKDPASGIPIADIPWHGKNYHRVFLGCDAIDWMIKNKVAMSRETGVQLGTELLMVGKLNHISRLMIFIDGMELYRFEGDEESRGGSDKLDSCFGSSLDELMQKQEKIAPDMKVPMCMEVIIKALYNLKGPETEGIFRVPCGLAELELSRANFNNGDYSVMGMRDAHLPACLLKLWLRELADAPIPAFYYNYAINCRDDAQSRWAVIESLPLVNQNVITRLFDILYDLSKYQAKTKMDINNLAMIFSPCLLRCPSTDPFVVIECLPREGTFVTRVLHDYVDRKKQQEHEI
eukprot:TRINITY_DN2134_c0_g1_i4.p1 TRINITY_DN2134_c0_g1~~TRINITY_DN2134_c0_g1_i4.p1  ORF type:complete len:881 (-),score=144.54 TRINITY_DN2134_c0_g1_i4:21-2663(-)